MIERLSSQWSIASLVTLTEQRVSSDLPVGILDLEDRNVLVCRVEVEDTHKIAWEDGRKR